MKRNAWRSLLLGTILLSACASPRGGETVHAPVPGTPLSPYAQAAMERVKADPSKVAELLPWFATEDNERLVRFVSTLGEPAVPPLVAVLSDPRGEYGEVAAALLGELKSPTAVPALSAYLSGKGKGRYAAAWALGEIRDPSSLPLLLSALSDPSEAVVKASTRALVNLGTKATPAVAEALASSSGRSRKAMLRALEDIEDVRAEDAVLRVLDTEKDPAVQAAAARALSKCGTVKSFAPLQRWLLEGATEVRVECAWSLGILVAKPAEETLRKTLEDPDVNVREWSARALENITGERILYRDAKGKMILPYNLYR
jgi:HEAT repeat protein